MSQKIESYIDGLFYEVPHSQKAMELREELLSNMRERYNDYIAQGSSETEAYSKAVAGMGDLDALIAEVMPDENFKREERFYRQRSAKNTAISVCLYILSPMVLIGLSELFDMDIVGLLAMFGCIAAATGLLIYTKMSTPPEFSQGENSWSRHPRVSRYYRGGKHPEKNKMRDAVLSLYWTVATLIYLGWSFLTFDWHITWVVWPLAAVGAQIITTVWEMRDAK